MGAQAVRLSNVDIDNALNNKDFEVLFQPIFDLSNGAMARVEAFVRWRHKTLGVLPPGAFISFFESQGRMSELTRYVLGEALREYVEWRGPSAPGFSINLAYSDLTDDSFAPHFKRLLRDHDFPAELVTLECPMPPVDLDLATAEASLSRVMGTGARLAIEVRGRANDFLKAVDPFPFDEIKTGGSAILRFARTVRGPGLSAISDLLEIANKANAAITAVGVEDQASLSALKGLGFTAAQGNHLGQVGCLEEFRPSKVNDVRSMLGLEPLTSDDLKSLFRTEAPEVTAPEVDEDVVSEKPVVDDGDALVQRLNERVARQAEMQRTTQNEVNKSEAVERARKAAKAKISERRAEKRNARKAAAIARVKSKTEDTAPRPVAAEETGEIASGDLTPIAPLAWRDQISEAFGPERAEPMREQPALDFTAPEDAPSDKPKTPPSLETGADKTLPKKAETSPPSSEPEQRAPQPATKPEAQQAEIDAEAAPDERQVKLSAGAVVAHFIEEMKVGAPELAEGPLIRPQEKGEDTTIFDGAAPESTPSFAPPAIEAAKAAPEEDAREARSIPELIGAAAQEEFLNHIHRTGRL